MFKVDYESDIESLLNPFHEFVLEVLRFVNEESAISITRETDSEIINEQVKLLINELKSRGEDYKFLPLTYRGEFKKYLYDLKFEEKNLLNTYETFTNDYSNILSGYVVLDDSLSVSDFTQAAFIYFYENLVKTKTFLDAYYLENMKDPKYKLRKIMTERKLCPYCNMTNMEFDLSSIDHFLPKDKFPLLSIFPGNLVVACSACNDRIKKNSITLPILHPYHDEIREYFKFDFDFDNASIRVGLVCKHQSEEKVKNFLELFKIEDRYNANVYKELVEYKESIRNEVRRTLRKGENLEVKGEYFDRLEYEKELLEKKKYYIQLSKIKLDLIEYLEREGWISEVKYISKRPSVFNIFNN